MCFFKLGSWVPRCKKDAPMAFQNISCPLVQRLVQTIQKDYNLVDDLSAKYLGVPVCGTGDQGPVPAVPVVPKKKKVPKEVCVGKTAKGEPCKFAVKCDGLCGIHLRQRDNNTDGKKEGSTVSKLPKKSKKETPKHTHEASGSDPLCGLCEEQGNVVVPELTKAEFEAVEEEGQSIQERLRAILANADEDEDDVEAPKVQEPLDSFDQMKSALLNCEAIEDENVSMKVKLAKLIAEEDSDSDIEEDVVEQMSETPPSQAKLKGFEELLEEMES